ncbi:iron-containing alcohol dehydrogenase [Marivita sp. S0852]|uniref:iron-containing alcohol dehydrogenase n=1 Tax=Marivita sp. S0852 TaxID=3373893 RepID=UPI003981F945
MHFGFATATEIRFGRGIARGAAQAAARISGSALLVHGKSAERARWLLEDLSEAGCRITTIACAREPEIDDVDAALSLARDARPGVVIALGGGATMDLAKAVAALVPAQGATRAYLESVGEGRALEADPLPLIALPTTAGTGSEVTKNAVIGVPDARKKVSLRDPRMVPDIAFVDPSLTDQTPAQVTFSSGLDAITQVIEPYLSVNASPLTDALCRDAIPRGLTAIVRLAQGEDPGARDDMALTSLVGGITLANAGLGAVHGLAGVIGSHTAAPHGAVCAALLPHVLAYNARAVSHGGPAAEKIAQVYGWIGAALDVTPDDAPAALGPFFARLGLRDLVALGVSPDDIEPIAMAARAASSSKFNPVPPDEADFNAILTDALCGWAVPR